MIPLIQAVIDIIGLLASVFAVTLVAIFVAHMLVRQLGWFGFNSPTDGD